MQFYVQYNNAKGNKLERMQSISRPSPSAIYL